MTTRQIKGETYKLVVLRIVEWDPHGRPSKAVIGYDDTTFRLDDTQQPNEFMTAFVPEKMCKAHSKQ